MTEPRRPGGRQQGSQRSATARPEPNLTTTGWPPVGYEDRDWASTIDEGHLDVWQRLKTARPYQAAVPPFIAGLDPRLRPDALTTALEATNEVTRFDTEMTGLPVPMPAVLLRTESASSSQIEHLTSNARNIALAELGGPGKENAALIVANAHAMTTALNAGGTVTPDTILAIHAALLQGAAPDHAGTWRDQQVWIGSSPLSPHDADFVPPHADRVPELIDDLCAFGRRSDVPPWCTPRSCTPSSRPSTRSSTATAAPVGSWFTPSSAATGSPGTPPSRCPPGCCAPPTGTSPP